MVEAALSEIGPLFRKCPFLPDLAGLPITCFDVNFEKFFPVLGAILLQIPKEMQRIGTLCLSQLACGPCGKSRLQSPYEVWLRWKITLAEATARSHPAAVLSLFYIACTAANRLATAACSSHQSLPCHYQYKISMSGRHVNLMLKSHRVDNTMQNSIILVKIACPT